MLLDASQTSHFFRHIADSLKFWENWPKCAANCPEELSVPPSPPPSIPPPPPGIITKGKQDSWLEDLPPKLRRLAARRGQEGKEEKDSDGKPESSIPWTVGWGGGGGNALSRSIHWAKKERKRNVFTYFCCNRFFCTVYDVIFVFFWRARVCWPWPLLCFCRPFCIFERFLDSNQESCRSKQARHPLSHSSPCKLPVTLCFF